MSRFSKTGSLTEGDIILMLPKGYDSLKSSLNDIIQAPTIHIFSEIFDTDIYSSESALL